MLDGWGLAPDGPGNAVSLAETPVFDELWQAYPTTTLTACGQAVGLPEGQMGNSEVGHLNLGAGSVVMQDLTRIDAAAEDGSLAANEVLREAFTGAERVHVIGLVSDGGVHSSLEHLRALIAMAASLEVARPRRPRVHRRPGYDAEVRGRVLGAGRRLGWARAGRAGSASVIGRYYAMDRDQRWDRVQQAYEMLVHGAAEHHADSGAQAARDAYERDETDEFIAATLVGEEARIRPGDSVVGLNFRPDRMREITQALADPSFDAFDRGTEGVVERYTTMTEYEEGWPYPVAFPPERPATTIAAVIAERGERQLHVAETEKYPHVTYFFNGGEEKAYDGEERDLVPSPRDVPTYDKKPAMSAPEAAEAFVSSWSNDPPTFGIINFANADMVGHTGVIPAAVAAVETVDSCLARVVEAVHRSGGACLITADHGNADHMLEPDGSPNTAHSLNPVPVIVTVPGLSLRGGGVLADVAPTLLAMLQIAQPDAMSGTSLIDALAVPTPALRPRQSPDGGDVGVAAARIPTENLTSTDLGFILRP